MSDKNIFYQMIPNSDPQQTFYDQIPRVGSLELSVNGIPIFSKLKSNYWPNAEKLTFKAMKVCDDIDKGIELDDYTESGMQAIQG